MLRTMLRQPAELQRLFADRAPVESAAARIAGRRTLLVGTGTSWHAANQGAHFLRLAGADAWALQAADAALYGPHPGASDALVLLSHRGTKRYTSQVLARAREAGVPTVVIGGIGAPEADLETVEQEISSAYTGSHLGALARLVQLAQELGADVGDVERVVLGPNPVELPTLVVGVVPVLIEQPLAPRAAPRADLLADPRDHDPSLR